MLLINVYAWKTRVIYKYKDIDYTTCRLLRDLLTVPDLSKEALRPLIVCTISKAILGFSASKSYRLGVPPPRVRTSLNVAEDFDDC